MAGGVTAELPRPCAAEPVLVPRDEADPVVRPDRVRPPLRGAVEHLLALLAHAQRAVERRARALGANPDERAERQPGDGEADAGRGEPVLVESEPGECEHDPAERRAAPAAPSARWGR